MPNIFHQSVEDVLKAASPEQRLLWNDVFLRFGERCSISQLIIRGVPGELATYVARKMYFAYQLTFTDRTTGGAAAGFPRIDVYDEANALQHIFNNNAAYWDATAAAQRLIANSLQVNNVLFSRMTVSAPYAAVIFIGYRIIY